MGAGKIGGQGQMADMRYRNSSTPISMDIFEPEVSGGPTIELPEFGQRQPGYQQPIGYGQPGGLLNPIFNQIGGRVADAMFGPQQNNQQYYQQMRESMQGMDKALKALEGVSTPGGQYRGNHGGQGGGGKGKGVSF